MFKTKSNNEVHPIGIGTWKMGGSGYSDGTPYPNYDHDIESIETITYSLIKGQNHIDTAQC